MTPIEPQPAPAGHKALSTKELLELKKASPYFRQRVCKAEECLNMRRPGSAYCQSCSDTHKRGGVSVALE